MAPRTRKTADKPRVLEPATPRITASDWRILPVERWTVRTFNVYFTDMNREMYGVDDYLPFRNWSTEQSILKRAIAAHGTELLRAAFDECFRTYRPNREYPLLTAGFAVNYRINAVIPAIKAEMAAKAEMERKLAEAPAEMANVASWL